MKKEALEKLSIEELKKKEKSLTFLTSLLAGVLTVLFGIATYNWITTKEFDTTFITGVALAVIIPFNYNQIKHIKKEIKRRQES